VLAVRSGGSASDDAGGIGIRRPLRARDPQNGESRAHHNPPRSTVGRARHANPSPRLGYSPLRDTHLGKPLNDREILARPGHSTVALCARGSAAQVRLGSRSRVLPGQRDVAKYSPRRRRRDLGERRMSHGASEPRKVRKPRGRESSSIGGRLVLVREPAARVSRPATVREAGVWCAYRKGGGS